MISNLQKAYVIHSRPYKETSLIVTFLTEKKGKISAVAKGAKRKNSRLSGNLEPFQCLNIDYRGKSDLKSLVLAEPSEVFEDFFGSENLYSAFYVNELTIHISYFYNAFAKVLNHTIQLIVYGAFLIYSNFEFSSYLLAMGVIIYFPTRILLKQARKFINI